MNSLAKCIWQIHHQLDFSPVGGEIDEQTPIPLMGSKNCIFSLFVGLDFLGVSSNTPKKHSCKVWDFLESV